MFVGIFGFYGAKLIPESYCGSPEWWNEELWYRIVYLLIAVEVGFTKYYFAWFNGEAHTILIGASYRRNPKTGAVSWDRISMLDLVPFRLAHNRFMIQMNWNICSGEWLKYCLFFLFSFLIFLKDHWLILLSSRCLSPHSKRIPKIYFSCGYHVYD